MNGKDVRKKIKERGFTYRKIAQLIGESEQNLQNILNAADVKSGTLERIAAAMKENVAYFYNEQPIFTMLDYEEYIAVRSENRLLRQIIEEKEQHIRLLSDQYFQKE
ncbi:MAG: hypothetical protein K2F92_05595 [Alistipes sp.]|nr:hypothetical protein [Alistipes sp.]